VVDIEGEGIDIYQETGMWRLVLVLLL